MCGAGPTTGKVRDRSIFPTPTEELYIGRRLSWMAIPGTVTQNLWTSCSKRLDVVIIDIVRSLCGHHVRTNANLQTVPIPPRTADYCRGLGYHLCLTALSTHDRWEYSRLCLIVIAEVIEHGVVGNRLWLQMEILKDPEPCKRCRLCEACDRWESLR